MFVKIATSILGLLIPTIGTIPSVHPGLAASTSISVASSTTSTPSSSFTNQDAFSSQKAVSINADIKKNLTPLTNTQIIEKIKPAVVYIENDAKITNGIKELGSGMIISSDGYVLTNAHVVSEAGMATVNLTDGRSYSAPVVGKDENIDVAILKLPGNSGFPSVSFTDSSSVHQGDNVYALGFPFGISGDVDFTNGVLSRRISTGGAAYLEVTANFHPGSSGGPLVNQYGQVIGINTASYTGGLLEQISGAGTLQLSIPINTAVALIPELENGLIILSSGDSTPVKVGTPLKPSPPSTKTALINYWPVYVDPKTDQPISANGNEIIASKIPYTGIMTWSGGAYNTDIWTDHSSGNVYAVPAGPNATQVSGFWLNPNSNDKYLIPYGGNPAGACVQYGESSGCFESFIEQ
jgi:S1-C subfamily serine protease